MNIKMNTALARAFVGCAALVVVAGAGGSTAFARPSRVGTLIGQPATQAGRWRPAGLPKARLFLPMPKVVGQRNSGLNPMASMLSIDPTGMLAGNAACANAFGSVFADMARGVNPQVAGARALMQGHALGLQARGLPGAGLLRAGAARLR